MKEEYKNCVDQIHAPKDLIKQTKMAVKQEEKNCQNFNKDIKTSIFNWKEVVIAASICMVLFAGGLGHYKLSNQITINTVTFSEENSFAMGLTLGKSDEDNTGIDTSDKEEKSDREDNIQIFKSEEKDEILEILMAMTPSKISGEKIYVGIEKETGTLYGCLERDQVYYKIIGNEIEKEEFIKYLKENIKNL